ncbi:MAG TPA: elongation factor P [Candidatus Paceibacterota bacterium]|jgi:elongation factor P|nr:elongation factor P [Candidatus Paceibacterota bacterium]HOH11263.1 elongation factor P [Candidatus Paceibacterota bacterium]HOY10959.1 elongation factor P [Candidatus Paceibacterota bacterium]HPB60266.1 elongation factor P [Candidatus Paceibacterota bacterium]HPN89690.1 elongation factor P [Candidatus Paceibacterota bacterium]
MLEYNEIKPRKFIVFEGEPFEVLTSHVFRKQQRKPVNAVKMRNLITGKVIENSFHQSEKVEEAELERRPIKYLYENRGQYWFCEVNDPSKRFEMPAETIADKIKFVRQNDTIDVLSFGDKVLGIEVPIKVELKVTDAPPAIKGNTVQGGLKQITLETGFTTNAPMFINEGDTVRINTETGEYVERV